MNAAPATQPNQQLIPGLTPRECIGRGGFALVYRAVQESLGREVAVKIDSRVMDDERNRRRFLREATAAAKISSHPHVVSLYDAGVTADNRPYLVMELCEGGSAADLIKQGPLGVADVLDLAIAVTGGLAAAHAAGVLHRDVKPANILIDAFGVPRLSDFGLAALPSGEDGVSVTLEAFTPAYAAPETFSYVQPTTRGDVWSMGATIHALLAGVAPRRAADGSPASIPEIIARLSEPLTEVNTPGAEILMPVLWRATALNPAERFADAGELLSALRQVKAMVGDRFGNPTLMTTIARVDHPVVVPRPTAPTVVVPPRTWPKLAAALVAGALIGGVGTFGGMKLAGGPAEVAIPTAEPSAQTSAGPSATPTDPPPPLGECWDRAVSIQGVTQQAKKVECTKPHSAETFASGFLTPETNPGDYASYEEDANVAKLCSEHVLSQYAGSDINVAYEIEVYAPTLFSATPGYAGFACAISFEDTISKPLR